MVANFARRALRGGGLGGALPTGTCATAAGLVFRPFSKPPADVFATAADAFSSPRGSDPVRLPATSSVSGHHPVFSLSDSNSHRATEKLYVNRARHLAVGPRVQTQNDFFFFSIILRSSSPVGRVFGRKFLSFAIQTNNSTHRCRVNHQWTRSRFFLHPQIPRNPPPPSRKPFRSRSPRFPRTVMNMLYPNLLFGMYIVLTLAEPPYNIPFKGQ